MERIAKILMAAGLVLMLCAPAAATAQAPWKYAPCGETPVIDGIPDPPWESAHWEDITIDFFARDGVSASQPFGIVLGTMIVGNTLYVGLAEVWYETNVQDGFHSVFCMGFEDDYPAWSWNGDEGWLCFVGLEGFVHPVQEWEWHSMDSIAFYIQRIGGDQQGPEDCFGELLIHAEGMPSGHPGFLPGLEHAFAAGMTLPEGVNVFPSQQGYIQFHEIAIDLSASPLTLDDLQKIFRGWFGAFAMGPEMFTGATGEVDYQAIAEVIADLFEHPPIDGPPDPYVHLMGFWPGGRDWGPEPEDQLAFLACLVDYYGADGARLTCDLGLPCFGEIEVCGREFVPEPSTLLLLSGGLMGLGGYVTLRLRKR